MKHVMHVVSLLIVVGFLLSCVGVPDISADSQTRSALRAGQSIEIIIYHPEKFEIITPQSFEGNPLSSLFGGLVRAINSPYGGVYDLPDTARLLAESLNKKLLIPIEATVQVNPSIRTLPVPKNTEEAYKASSKSSNYIFEISWPLQWFGYKAMAWGTYHYQGAGSARLIENSTGKVVWSHRCLVSKLRDDDEDSLSLDKDEFSANNGQRIREILLYAVERCTEKMPSAF